MFGDTRLHSSKVTKRFLLDWLLNASSLDCYWCFLLQFAVPLGIVKMFFAGFKCKAFDFKLRLNQFSIYSNFTVKFDF